MVYGLAANLTDFTHITKLSFPGSCMGFAFFRHAMCCMTIFYQEVKISLSWIIEPIEREDQS